MSARTFRTKCMCGCGDGIEMEVKKGRIEVSFFREDAGAGTNLLKERADYVAGKNLLREIMMDRETFQELLSFMESAELDPIPKGGANKSHLAPTHLLDDIYAVWLQGTLAFKAVFGNEFKKMFHLSLTAMDRDVLVVQMRNWLAREKTHAIPEGASPHVDRLAGTSAPKPKLPSKEEAKGIAATALKSVQAAAKAAMGAARKTADPEGHRMEQELYGEDGGVEEYGPGADTDDEDEIPDVDVVDDPPEPGTDLSGGLTVNVEAIMARAEERSGRRFERETRDRADTVRSAMTGDGGGDDDIPEIGDDDDLEVADDDLEVVDDEDDGGR